MNKNILIFDRDSDWFCKELIKKCPNYVFHSATTIEEAKIITASQNIQIVCGLAPYISEDLIAQIPNLEWILATTTGVDNLLGMKNLSSNVAITNSKGFHGPQMSELAIMLMMATARKFPEMIANQNSKNWERWPQPLLFNKTVCIVGLGSIAEELAKRCIAFEMRVTGVSNGRTEVDGFDKVFKREAINEAVSDADFVVVVVPYSDETHHIINNEVLISMKAEAILVNISRGGCVDKAALINCLRKFEIAGAALDVFETEPLPMGSEIWKTPNLIVTPHIGGMSDIYRQQVLPLIVEKLNAYSNDGIKNLQGLINRP